MITHRTVLTNAGFTVYYNDKNKTGYKVKIKMGGAELDEAQRAANILCAAGFKARPKKGAAPTHTFGGVFRDPLWNVWVEMY